MKGSCLCGEVRFSLSLSQLNIYQCHCQQCRKQTGTASSCGGVVKAEDFIWLVGESSINKWQKSSGFSAHFCVNCGSSMPNKFRGIPYYWVPAGVLESDNINTVANIFVKEKVNWSNVNAALCAYQEKPAICELIQMLVD